MVLSAVADQSSFCPLSFWIYVVISVYASFVFSVSFYNFETAPGERGYRRHLLVATILMAGGLGLVGVNNLGFLSGRWVAPVAAVPILIAQVLVLKVVYAAYEKASEVG